MMCGVFQIVSLAALLTVTTAQCSGRLTNSFVLSWIANNTHVRFTMSAPSKGNQYIAVSIFNAPHVNVSNYVLFSQYLFVYVSLQDLELRQILSLLETMGKGKALWKIGQLSYHNNWLC